jgi:hypothetical protein
MMVEKKVKEKMLKWKKIKEKQIIEMAIGKKMFDNECRKCQATAEDGL